MGESECKASSFLTSALDGDEWSASRPGRFTPGGIALGTHWIGSWVGPRAGLDAVENRRNLSLAGNRTLAVQPSLYRLSYPNPITV
jgi:hypothetical protein